MIAESIDLECRVCDQLTSQGTLHDLPIGRVVGCGKCSIVTLRTLTGSFVECSYDLDYYGGGVSGGGYRDYLGSERGIREAVASAIVKAIQGAIAPASTVLDIGCGAGYLVQAAQAAGFSAMGIDTSVAAVPLSRLLGIPPGAVQRASISDLSTARSARFDVVTLFDVIEHVEDPIEFMRASARFVTKGGVMIVATPRFGGWLYEAQREGYIQFKRDHIYYLTEETLSRVAERAGFRNWTMTPFLAFLGQGGLVPDSPVTYKYSEERDHLVMVIRP